MERRSIEVRGIVQGVGFRPFVYGLASRYSLAGFVQNRLGSVHIELEGEPSALAAFCDDLTQFARGRSPYAGSQASRLLPARAARARSSSHPTWRRATDA
jgi:hydrogenase maturation protein HypF